MRYFFKNQHGFSMLMGLLLSGILAASGLMISRLLIDEKKGMKVAQSNDESEELHQLIFTILTNSDNCQPTLSSAVNANQNLFESNTTNLSVNEIWINSHKVIDLGAPNAPARIGFGTNSASLVESKLIKSIILSPMKNSDPGIRNLEIKYAKINNNSAQSGVNTSQVKRVIPLRVKTKSDGTFESCYAIASNDWSDPAGRNDLPKKMCLELSLNNTGVFVWDDQRSTCTLNLKCPDGEIYNGIKSDGTVDCRKLQDLINYNDVLDNTSNTSCPIGSLVSFQINNTTKKVRISCAPPP